jgi:hypothetical protein
MIHHHNPTALEMMAMWTLACLLRNFHATHLACLGGKWSGHMMPNDQSSATATGSRGIAWNDDVQVSCLDPKLNGQWLLAAAIC